jgi:tRNA 2-selenouridine synthase
MAIERIQIDKFLSLANLHPVIDVRSPAEYDHAHIPGAFSMPLFTDEERKIVGTAYKQESRQQAIKIGLGFFGPKMRLMIEQAEQTINQQDTDLLNTKTTNSKTLLIYCWRGGMRSAGVAWLMDLYGFKVYTLSGGYKSFRTRVLSTFQQPFQFHILGGYTGSGKTEVLKELKNKGEKVIDLEAIASHKGSAFGNIDLPKQPTQEMFENNLALELINIDNHHSCIWLEDESQRIGLVNIPHELWKTMRLSPVYFLNIPFEERLKHLVEEYGCLDKEKVGQGIQRIKKRLGSLETKNALNFWEEKNITECFRILLKYYDKYYIKGLHNRGNAATLIKEINCKKVHPSNAEKLSAEPANYESR